MARLVYLFNVVFHTVTRIKYHSKITNRRGRLNSFIPHARWRNDPRDTYSYYPMKFKRLHLLAAASLVAVVACSSSHVFHEIVWLRSILSVQSSSQLGHATMTNVLHLWICDTQFLPLFGIQRSVRNLYQGETSDDQLFVLTTLKLHATPPFTSTRVTSGSQSTHTTNSDFLFRSPIPIPPHWVLLGL